MCWTFGGGVGWPYQSYRRWVEMVVGYERDWLEGRALSPFALTLALSRRAGEG